MLPTVDIFGFTIAEPTTTVTDYLITAVAWWLGARLVRLREHALVRRLWASGFFFIGLAALFGGTSHGFAPHLDALQLFYLWKATVYSVGLSMLFAVAGTITGAGFPRFIRSTLHGLNLAAFAVYAGWMIDHSDFIYVIYHYVPAMFSIALIQGYEYWRRRASSAPWLIWGVLVTLLGAVVQRSGFTLHPHFNHNDLYHLIQVAGLILLHRGAVLIEPSGRIE